jgi:VCBS repeat-containing protein/CshA-type fibril repeat protein
MSMAATFLKGLLNSTALGGVSLLRAPLADGGGGSPARKQAKKQSSHYIALEPRLLFDGAAAETLEQIDAAEGNLPTEVASDSHLELLAALGESDDLPTADTSAQEIVFIDGSLEDLDVILADIGPDVEVHILTPEQDGVEQIAALLQGRKNINAIHIISHGTVGDLALGSAHLNSASMVGEHADDLAVIATALSEQADILIYGCDFAADEQGQQAAALLASLTGADVAASDDATGATDIGGDWVLENAVGTVETIALAAESYDHLLTLGNTTSWTISGLSASNTIQGVTATISFSAISPQSSVTSLANNTFNANTFFANGAESDPSLAFVFNWDTTPEAATSTTLPQASTDGGTATITITFSQPVTNPIIHLDRLGGNMAYDPNTSVSGDEVSQSNSSLWTLTTPGATLTDLSVPTNVPHFSVTSTTIQRTPNQNMVFSPSAEAGTNGTNSTAAGSVQVNGTFTSITFTLSGVGPEGAGGDGIEIGLSLDAPPNAQNDAFTINEDTTLTGNLYANNGSGVDSDPTSDAITITQINGASFTVGTPIALANGTLTITNATTGAFTFTPNADYTGGQSFTYTIADANGGTDTATVNITVNAVNDPPQGTDNTITTDEDVPVALSASSFGFSDPDDSPANSLQSVTITTLPTTGTLFLSGVPVTTGQVVPVTSLGNLSWTPPLNGNGAGLSSFTFQVTDDGGTTGGGQDTDQSPNTITFNVTAVNDSPVLDNDGNNSSGQTGADYETTYVENNTSVPVVDADVSITDLDSSTIEEATITLTNAFPLDSLQVGAMPLGIAAFVDTSTPGVITVTLTGPASLDDFEAALQAVRFLTTSENPDPTDRIVEITVNDGFATSNLATTTINVVPVNDNPTLDLDGNNSSGVNAGNYNTSYTENALPVAIGDVDTTILDLDDTNIEGATITLTNGKLGDLLSVGTLPAGISVVGSPPTNLTADGTITIQLTGSASLADYQAAIEAIGFSSNSDDIDPATRTVTVVVTDGDVNSNTARSFISIVPVNDPPVATDNSAVTPEDTILTGNVLTDGTPDSDVEGDTLAVAGFDIDTDGDGTAESFNAGDTATIMGVGTLVINSDGSYTFTPEPNYDGPVPTATYTLTDGALTDTATLSIDITPVNDAPVAVDDGPVAVTEDTPVSGNVITDAPGTDSDIDGDTLTVTSFDIDTDGDGTPETFNAGDTATITGVGTLVINSDGSYTFTPEPDYDGPVPSATYTITDGTETDDAVLSFADITDVNDAPVGVDDTIPVTEDTPVTQNVLGNDTDVDGDPLTISAAEIDTDGDGTPDPLVLGTPTPITDASGNPIGTITVDSNGDVTFEPAPDYVGPVPDLSYTPNDGTVDGTPATVSFGPITPVNDAPVANDDGPVAVAEDTPVSGNVLPNDSDVDGDTLTVTEFTVAGVPGTFTAGDTATIPGVGTLVINSDGSYTFTPEPNYDGPVPSATYTITDGTETDEAVLSFADITDVNDAPVANDDGPVAVTEDTPVSGNVLPNDTDVDGDTLTVTQFVVDGDTTVYAAGDTATIAGVGTLVINSDGSYTFTPELNYDGPVPSATYTITDGTETDDAVLSFADITDVNDPPVGPPGGQLPPATTNDGATLVLPLPVGSFSDPDGDALTYTLAPGAPSWLSINPTTGEITGIVPTDASANGPYAITVIATDPSGETAQAVLPLTVTNPPPIAEDDASSGDEDTVQTGNVLPNDSDTAPDSDPIVVSAVNGLPGMVGQPIALTYGSVTVNPDGSWTFTPNSTANALSLGETVTETVTYTISDGNGGTATAELEIEIVGVNDAPETSPVPDQSNDDGETVTPLDVGSLFTDPDGDPLTFSASDLPPGLVIDPDTGVISGTLDPDASQGGPYSVTVTATDPDGNTYPVSFDWVVNNPVPVAEDNAIGTPEDTPVTVGVLGNDSDPDGDPLEVVGTSDPANGVVVINPDGSITYTPDPGFNGEDTFTYTISDGNGGIATATVTVTVGPVNDLPEATPIAPQENDDSDVVTFDVSGNFSDPDGDDLDFAANGLPPGLSIDPETGVISGTLDPSASEGGPYTVTITATDPGGDTVSTTFAWVVNNPLPDAVDNTVGTPEDTPVTFSVLGNDSDPDGDPLSITSYTQPANGTVVLNPDGTFTYTPPPGFSGATSFTYTIDDGNGGTDTATVNVTVGPVNDLPEATEIPAQENDDADTPTLDVSGNFSDPDGDPLTFAANGLPPGLSIDPDTGIISGTIDPSASQDGPYTVTVTATDPDGELVSTSFVWTVNNPAPVAGDNTTSTPEDTPIIIGVLGNDSDADDPISITATTPPANGSVVVNPDGTITYTPDAGFSGTDTFTYTITDADGATDTATVTVNVGPVNDSPLASTIPTQDDADGEDITPLDVSGAFTDPDGDDLTFTASGLPPGLTIDTETGIITGTLDPDASQGGPYTVTVIATDPSGDETSTTFTWNVTNPPPVAEDDSETLVEDTPVSGNVLTDGTADHDTAPDSDPLTVTQFEVDGDTTVYAAGDTATIAGVGTLVINSDGSYTFTPEPNYDGPVPVATYTISDGNGGTDDATLTLTITPVNDPPVVVDPEDPGDPTNPDEAPDPDNIIPDVETTDGATPADPNVAQYFVDPEGDTLTFTATGLPPGLTMAPDGTISGTIDPDASQGGLGGDGVYLVTITADDGNGGTATTTVTYTITNPPPDAVDDASSEGEDTVQTGNVLPNDSDTAPDSDPIVVSAVGGGTVGAPIALTYGTLLLNADGSWTFTPNAQANALAVGEVVEENITYTISDGQGGTDTAVLSIEIVGTNDAPVAGDLPNQSDYEGDEVTADVTSGFTDPDGDDLDYSATGLPPGLTIDPETGLITGTIDPGAANDGPYAVTITADDGNGGTVSITFEWEVLALSVSVDPPNPVPPTLPPIDTAGPGPIRHVITETVNELDSLDGTPELTDHVITRATNGLASLHGSIDIERGDGVITRLVEWLGRQGKDAQWLQDIFDNFDVSPNAGDALDLALTLDSAEVFRLKTVIVDDALFIGVDILAHGAEVSAIHASGGAGLPANVALIDSQNLVVNIIGAQEWIDLSIHGLLPSGIPADWLVSINTQSGEIITAALTPEKIAAQ